VDNGLPILFRSYTVVTPDEASGATVTEEAHVAVVGDRIGYAGTDLALAKQSLGAGPHVEYTGNGKLLLPAFANAHGHTAMVLMRNAADDLNLHDWLFQVIFPMEARLRRQDVYNGSLLGIIQMIRTGTGACADMYYHSDATLEAAVTAGIRMNLCCEGKESGPDPGSARVLPDALSDFVRLCESTGKGRIRPSLMIHSVYLYDEALYPALTEMAKTAGIPIQTHLAETRKEVEDCIARYGRRPAEQMERFGMFEVPCIAAHAVHLDAREMELLSTREVTLVHNPSSNMKLGSGVAPVCEQLACGIPVALGTDGAASNNALDIYREMRLAAFLAKGTALDASALPAATVLRMATETGMKAMGFPDSGRIEAGAKADLQILDTGDLSLCPLGDPLSAIVYSADSCAVESLMIDGRMLMHKRELLTLDEERIRYEAVKSARFITDRTTG